jgi:hypothetical protein
VYGNIGETASPQEPVQTKEQPKGYPEVEIGSSSDDEAPPPPESTQLARQNLELRNRVVALAEQSKMVEMRNNTLKTQLVAARDSFKKQLKAGFRHFFK